MYVHQGIRGRLGTNIYLSVGVLGELEHGPNFNPFNTRIFP